MWPKINLAFLREHSIWLIWPILLLSLFLRSYNYWLFPVAGETADESAWSILGASLWQGQAPLSWSYFEPYQTQQKIVDPDQHFVQPALDHPPVFSLIPGLAHFLSAAPLTAPSIKVVRLPLILLATLNVGLLWLVARRWFKSVSMANLAALLMAVIPTIVFSSRLVVAENWLITLLLSQLLVVTSDHWSKNSRFLGVIIINSLAIWSKFSGVVLPLGLLAWAIIDRQARQYWWPALISLVIGLGGWAIYGAVFDWQLFVDIFFAQSGRELGLATLVNRIFLHPMLVDKYFFDGWLFLGILAALIFSFESSKKPTLLTIYLVLNWLFVAASVGEQSFHGWYEFVNFPIYVLCLSWFIIQLFKDQKWWLWGISWLWLLPSWRLFFTHAQLEISTTVIRILVGSGFMPILVSLKKPQLAKKIAWGLLASILVTNLVTIFIFSHRVYWETATFFNY